MIKSDSRRIKTGDTFIAIKGTNDDGHNYIDDAIKRGANRVIVEHGNYEVDTLVVADTKKYLKDYLVSNYKKIIDEMTIIGVTGTNGKTTIGYLLYQSLNMLGVRCSLIGTLGYFKGDFQEELSNTCPELSLMYELLIDSYNSGYRCVVMEASSQGLYEDRLYGVSFDFAIFTNLTHDHMDFHKNMINYAHAKQKLFLQLKKTGIGIVNIDDSYRFYFNCSNLVTYGFGRCDYRIKSFEHDYLTFHSDCDYKVSHNLIGSYNAYNLMACFIVLDKMGFDFSSINKVFSVISGPKGRMEVYNYKNNRIIVDYAHTPDAVEKVLCSISDYNKIFAVFGCTGNRDRLKRPIMTKLLLDNCNHVIITSDDLYNESFESILSDMLDGVVGSNYSICPDRGNAIMKGISFLNDNDVLLVLGKGHEEFLKIGHERIPFNDGRFILDFINKSV